MICGQRVDLSAAEFYNIEGEDAAFESGPRDESCDVTGSSSEDVLVVPLVDTERTVRVDRQNSMELLSSETCDLKLSPRNQSKAEPCDVSPSSTSKKTGTGVDIETESKMADSVASANTREGVSSSASSKNKDSSEFQSSEMEPCKPGRGTARKSGGRADSGSGMCDLVDTVLDPFGADASAQLEEFFQAHTPQFEVVKEQTNR